jgi:hypothetical protein
MNLIHLVDHNPPASKIPEPRLAVFGANRDVINPVGFGKTAFQ